MEQVEFILDQNALQHDCGNCWIIGLPEYLDDGDDADNPSRSNLQLWEGNRLLGPAHADHNRIRNFGQGLYSHWGRSLYFSSSTGSTPSASGLIYRIRASKAEPSAKKGVSTSCPSDVLFPHLDALAKELRKASPHGSLDFLYNPKGSEESRVKMLEAKVEYLLDELYTAKSKLRRLISDSEKFSYDNKFQLDTFDFQWKQLPYHDNFLTNVAWRNKAADDVCHRLEVSHDWFIGKRILDCGSGPGRHAWAFSTLGAQVTAFDMSDNGLQDARRECAQFATTTFDKHNILDPLPYSTDFDLVWCYGVIHCTGDTEGALTNIARHVKPCGLLYFMVYPEPERTNLDSYKYYHEVYVIRKLLQHLDFAAKAEIIKKIQGERWALSWFDAISSEVNDLYTFEEAREMLTRLGFSDVKRTAPEEHSMNVVATRQS